MKTKIIITNFIGENKIKQQFKEITEKFKEEFLTIVFIGNFGLNEYCAINIFMKDTLIISYGESFVKEINKKPKLYAEKLLKDRLNHMNLEYEIISYGSINPDIFEAYKTKLISILAN